MAVAAAAAAGVEERLEFVLLEAADLQVEGFTCMTAAFDTWVLFSRLRDVLQMEGEDYEVVG